MGEIKHEFEPNIDDENEFDGMSQEDLDQMLANLESDQYLAGDINQTMTTDERRNDISKTQNRVKAEIQRRKDQKINEQVIDHTDTIQ